MFGGSSVTHWLGYVESKKDPMSCGRIQIRVISAYDNASNNSEEKALKDKNIGRGIADDELPWAMTVMPLDAYNNTMPAPQVPDGAIVYGVCFDGDWMQKMLCLGIVLTGNLLSDLSTNPKNASTSKVTGGNGAGLGASVLTDTKADPTKIPDALKNMKSRRMQCGDLQSVFQAQIVPESGGDASCVARKTGASGLIQTTNGNMIDSLCERWRETNSEEDRAVYGALISCIATRLNSKIKADSGEADLWSEDEVKTCLKKLGEANMSGGDYNNKTDITKYRSDLLKATSKIGSDYIEKCMSVLTEASNMRLSTDNNASESYILGYACYLSENTHVKECASIISGGDSDFYEMIASSSYVQAECHHEPATARAVIKKMYEQYNGSLTKDAEGNLYSWDEILSYDNFVHIENDLLTSGNRLTKEPNYLDKMNAAAGDGDIEAGKKKLQCTSNIGSMKTKAEKNKEQVVS